MQGDHPLFGPTANSNFILVKRKTLQQDETVVRMPTMTAATSFLNHIAHDYRNIETMYKVASVLEGRVVNDKEKVVIELIAKALTEQQLRILEITKSIWE